MSTWYGCSWGIGASFGKKSFRHSGQLVGGALFFPIRVSNQVVIQREQKWWPHGSSTAVGSDEGEAASFPTGTVFVL